MARITAAHLKTILREAKAYADGKTSPTLTKGLDILMRHGTRVHAVTATKPERTTRKKPAPPLEEWTHTSFVAWVKSKERDMPDLRFLYHPANGGKRHIVTALKMRNLGVRKGTPDIHWPLPRSHYTGLWIEFKRANERPTKDQHDWHDWLRSNGAYVVVLTDWLTARDLVLWYHGLPER